MGPAIRLSPNTLHINKQLALEVRLNSITILTKNSPIQGTCKH